MLSWGSPVPKSTRCKDARSLTAFTSIAAGNSETTQRRGLYTKDGVAPIAGATSFSSLGKVKEDGLAGGVGPSLDNYVISGRTPTHAATHGMGVGGACSSGLIPATTDDDWVLRTIPRTLTLISSSSGLSAREAACKLLNIEPNHGNGYGDPQTRRIRRFYQRYFTGVGVGGRLRVLTLTTSNEALAEGKNIHRSFRLLVKRLRRKFGGFEYIGVKEFKGDREHLHLVFRGEYMLQALISDMWRDIHSSPIVYIQAVQSVRGGARYLAKYLAKDMCNRYWASYNWVFKGWVGWSRQFCKQAGHYPHRAVLQSLARLDIERRTTVMQLLIQSEPYFVPFHSWCHG